MTYNHLLKMIHMATGVPEDQLMISGSCAYGPWLYIDLSDNITTASDVDILVPCRTKVQPLIDRIQSVTRTEVKQDPNYRDSQGSIYLTICGIKVNLVLLDTVELAAWRRATIGMRTQAMSNPFIFQSKEIRVTCFKAVCTAVTVNLIIP